MGGPKRSRAYTDKTGSSEFVSSLDRNFDKMANMKRGGEYDNGMGGPKRSRAYTDKFEMRILVPSKMAGSVIGKGGQNIQKIRSDFQAQVRIPDCPGPERVMSVVASDPDIVTSVLQSAIPYMYEQGEGADDVGRERAETVDTPVYCWGNYWEKWTKD